MRPPESEGGEAPSDTDGNSGCGAREEGTEVAGTGGRGHILALYNITRRDGADSETRAVIIRFPQNGRDISRPINKGRGARCHGKTISSYGALQSGSSVPRTPTRLKGGVRERDGAVGSWEQLWRIKRP